MTFKQENVKICKLILVFFFFPLLPGRSGAGREPAAKNGVVLRRATRWSCKQRVSRIKPSYSWALMRANLRRSSATLYCEMCEEKKSSNSRSWACKSPANKSITNPQNKISSLCSAWYESNCDRGTKSITSLLRGAWRWRRRTTNASCSEKKKAWGLLTWVLCIKSHRLGY